MKKEENKNKTASYTRKAIDNYRKDKKLLTITLTMADYERLKAQGIETAADVRRVLLEYIKK